MKQMRSGDEANAEDEARTMLTAFPAIVCTEDTLWGSPRIDGRRLAVGDVVSTVKYGGLHEALADFKLSRSEISQDLHLRSNLRCKTNTLNVFCHNCSLRSEQEGPSDTSELEEIISEDSVSVKGENFLFFGSMAELLENYCGYDWWKIATDLLIDFSNELPTELTP